MNIQARILSIEDDPEMSGLIQLIFERKGHRVIGARRGEIGLELIKSLRPDVLLLDLMLPDIDGWELYHQMKIDKEMAKVPIIIVNPWNAINPAVSDHIKPNRDYYDAVSNSAQTSVTIPFNGTTGMGFGTLANRPITCSTNTTELGGGVGYFATDQGPLGTLYRCAATNTWTVHYTPYTYPHPLQATGTARSTNLQDIPTNVQVR